MRLTARHIRAHSVSYLALFVALTGSAYAAVSVSGRDVVNGSLTGSDVRPNALTDELLQASAISSARRGPRGPRGPRGLRGPTGLQGPPGVPGAAGPAGTSGFQVVTATVVNPADVEDTSPDTKYGDVRCPAGLGAIAGGGLIAAVDSVGQPDRSPLVHIRESYKLAPAPPESSGWRVIGLEELGGFDDQWSVTTYAYCATL